MVYGFFTFYYVFRCARARQNVPESPTFSFWYPGHITKSRPFCVGLIILHRSWDFDLPSPTTIASSADENMVRICFPSVTLGNYLPLKFLQPSPDRSKALSLVPTVYAKSLCSHLYLHNSAAPQKSLSFSLSFSLAFWLQKTRPKSFCTQVLSTLWREP